MHRHTNRIVHFVPRTRGGQVQPSVLLQKLPGPLSGYFRVLKLRSGMFPTMALDRV